MTDRDIKPENTRPDVFGLAREVLAYTDGLGDLDARRLATALLALEPVWQAAQEWESAERMDVTVEPFTRDLLRAIGDLKAKVHTARAALGRETT